MDETIASGEVGFAPEGDVAKRNTPGGGRKPRAGKAAKRSRGVRFEDSEDARLVALAATWGVDPSEAIRRSVSEAADREGLPPRVHEPDED